MTPAPRDIKLCCYFCWLSEVPFDAVTASSDFASASSLFRAPDHRNMRGNA